MRQQSGRTVRVNGRPVYVEESGRGAEWVVFEAGSGLGRACWDPVLPLLAERARLVAYDRAGFGRSGRTTAQLGIDDMAADLVALVKAVVPEAAPLVVVAHSMGGLVTRRAAARLGPRLRGLLLLDPMPERAPIYDTFDRTAANTDRVLAAMQALVRFRPLARLLSGNVHRVFPADTYATMLAEDIVPAGIAQTRREIRAVAAAIPRFRAEPPSPPACPTVVLSASRPEKGRERQHAAMALHMRQWAESLPDGRFEEVDSRHLIMAEQPGVVAGRVERLLERAARPAR